MASEDLGYWTFWGSDVRALLFYLSGDVEGLRTVRECQGRERKGEKRRGKERKTEISEKRKRQEDAERNEVSQRRTQTRESERKTEMKGRREQDWGRAKKLDSFLTRRDGSTVNHSFIPSALYPSLYSLHMNRGCVILIKRNRVTVEPFI